MNLPDGRATLGPRRVPSLAVLILSGVASIESRVCRAERWTLALERSLWHISIIKVECDELAGFVRATSDLALNANLWNLAAKPGADQAILFTVLVHRALHILRRDLPGCSLSVSAPADALDALKSQGFVIDPNGIRAMGLSLS